MPSRHLSLGSWALAAARSLDTSAFIWLVKRVSQRDLEISRLEDFYSKFAEMWSFAKIVSASRRQGDKWKFVEASSIYTPCLHCLPCLPMPRALLRVEKDRQGMWTAVISMQHKTPNKKIEGYKCPSLEVLLLKALLFPSHLFCSPFPVPYTQVGLLLSMFETDPKAAGKTKNGSCLFLQRFNWVGEERSLVKRILLWVIQSLRSWGRKGGGMVFPRWQVGGWCRAARLAAGSSQCTKPALEDEQ